MYLKDQGFILFGCRLSLMREIFCLLLANFFFSVFDLIVNHFSI